MCGGDSVEKEKCMGEMKRNISEKKRYSITYTVFGWGEFRGDGKYRAEN